MKNAARRKYENPHHDKSRRAIRALAPALALILALMLPRVADAARPAQDKGESTSKHSDNTAQQSTASAQQPGKAAQQSDKASPAATPADIVSTLSEMLVAACRQDTAKFPEFLTAKNAAYYRQLSALQQVALLRRMVLLEGAGHALLSTDANGRTILRCDTTSWTGEIHLGVPRVEQSLAFVPVLIKPDRQIDFGLVMTSGGWKLLSIGVLMLDLHQLQPEWDAQEMADREEDTIKAMYKIWAAIDTYRNAFEKLPETLAQLGPAPKEGISPDAAGLLVAELVAPHVGGYTFRYRVLPPLEEGKNAQYELSAVPDEYSKSGRRSFFINASGKMRGGDKAGAPATAADPLLEEATSPH
jgi:hypothetical protein